MFWSSGGTAPHRRWDTLSLQLTGILLLISIVPLLFYYLVSSTAAERTILDVASQQSLETLRNQRDYLLLQTEQIESLAANLSQVEEIASALSRPPAAGGSAYDILATKARIGYLLSNYRNLHGLVSIDIFGLDGTHYHVGDTLTESSERFDLRDRLLDQTLRSKSIVTWHGVQDNIEKNSSSQKVLVASRMLLRPNSSWLRDEPLAMLLFNYSTDSLHERISAVAMGPGAYLMVVDKQRRLIYHPDKSRIGSAVTGEFAALLTGPSASFTQRLGNSEVLLSYESIAEKGWYVVSVIPKETLLAPMNKLRRVAALMLATMVVAILVLLRLLALRVVSPIAVIAESFRRFQLGLVAPGWRLPRPKSLEPIADLAQWFNTFLEHMERRQDSETQMRIAATVFESEEGMFVLDAQVRILRVNGALLAMMGYSLDEAVGRHANKFASDRHGADFFQRMRSAVEQYGSWRGEVWNRRKNGEEFPAWITVTGVKNEHGVLTHFVSTLTDITQRKASEEEIRHLAFYDGLTGLPNRRLLTDRLRLAMRDSTRRGQALALMFLDIDRFKTLNDTLGHDAGDSLLREVAHRLVRCVREVDTVARLGGDEFVVLVEGLGASAQAAAAQAEAIALKILAALNEDYMNLAGATFHSTASIGIVVCRDGTSGLEEIMKQADIAMYQAKEAGRNTLRFFEPAMQARLMVRSALEQSIRQGLLAGQFIIHLQPKVGDAGCIVGAEALVRWEHPQRGLIQPQAFIALAEETGLILPLGEVVLRSACEQLVAWSQRPDRRHLGVAVNVSPRQFRHADFVETVLRIVREAGADPTRLTLEITESLLVDNVTDIVGKMNALRHCGIGFALDDFGTGYSSLAYLKMMPLQELKIDRSFVRDVLTDANDATIVLAMIGLSRALGIEVVAEGVETQAQYDFLVAGGCHTFQGYLFGAPQAPAAFDRLMQFMPGDRLPVVA